MVRELGPLMTTVVLAARTGSAFAASIGTMKVNEEVDALYTMGLDPVRFLITPKVLAAVLVTPLLTAFCTLSGIVGGAVVSVTILKLPLVVYTNQLLNVVELHDFLGGMAKAMIFGILVAAIGCIRGLQTRQTPTAVGEATTSAVVSGIVLIAITDAVLAVLYRILDI
jgi:phospholipid/cholesterol/gamma-HCH transport system permease protein